jgi:hypothetical protein
VRLFFHKQTSRLVENEIIQACRYLLNGRLVGVNEYPSNKPSYYKSRRAGFV